ncbi:DUF2235 domain-containing protein [Paracoccus spongiarum]|uniref:DUF2235 domain-containing protein n=1 Tax=Paracoccus spongiarum TaxID=3064387 RepID=A0ABT9JEE6_9RHOB|nr:DUF2235 domain-containing protein [Paracoccus sp. 2205BS29-5]MDP5308201.1 DUF2235 domain-containing protein [Paracoccus sp. 2205BS29-5]
MKRISIFCDGTWSHADQRNTTNVALLNGRVLDHDADGVSQVQRYFPGVGVVRGRGPIFGLAEKLAGGAMGIGLDDRILEAYGALSQLYEPGDQVMVFGFSRGAYTARSLIGLIRNAGLPPRVTPALARACMALYRDTGPATAPDAPASLDFRLRHSPGITTSRAEIAFRADRTPDAVPFRITYLGCWETVGSLGVPANLPTASLLNRRYRFHDTALSSMVMSARHAVALDERRRTYAPALWSNLARLRRENPEGSYLQEWFPGVHGAVGGGGDIAAISTITLMWIAEGAQRAGLALDRLALRQLRGKADLLGPLPNRSARPSPLWRLLPQRDRAGPDSLEDLAHPAIARCRAARFPRDWTGRPYRPGPLRALERHILRADAAALGDYTGPFA